MRISYAHEWLGATMGIFLHRHILHRKAPRNLKRIWPRLLADDRGVDLNDDKFRIFTGTLRLVPVDNRCGNWLDNYRPA